MQRRNPVLKRYSSAIETPIRLMVSFDTILTMIKKQIISAILFLAIWLPGDLVHADVLTIMAANLSTGNYQSYEEQGIRIFQGLQPDIVLIQEFSYRNGSLRDLVDLTFGPEFFFVVEAGGHTIPNGIISRFPILDSGEWPDPEVNDRDFVWAVIDIPGDIPLQCVSVHFKGSSGSDNAAIRTAQAQAVLNYIDLYFDPDAYCVIGGDLNTYSTAENALVVLAGAFEVDTHVPVDQLGNRNTNEPRNRPYDWILPNILLDTHHVSLTIGSNTFPDGLVFDSYVYTPLNEVYPIQYGDSHDNQMQHMAVIKAFDIPGASGTPTPTRTATPPVTPTRTPTAASTSTPGESTHTPTPVFTSSPTASSTPTATPSQTGTPGPDTPTPSPTQPDQTPTTSPSHLPTATPSTSPTPLVTSVTITMPAHQYRPGDTCYCTVTVTNGDPEPLIDHPLFLILDVYGEYFFAPSFTGDFDYYSGPWPPGTTPVDALPEFTWPDTGTIATGIIWYAAITDPDVTRIVGEWDAWEFGWL